MKQNEYLEFLRQNQPMPDNPTPELLARYREATNFFYENPDPLCIPLFLHSFGNWEDLTIYESVQSVLRLFPAEKVVAHLPAGLTSPNGSVRSWCADTAILFPDPSLVAYIKDLLKDPAVEIRLPAAAAMEKINSPSAREAAAQCLKDERDEDVKEILESILARSS